MTELILHHYEGSPFSEKVRLILGFKGLSWRSVTVPVMLPKPDVVALTGGYRRTPFLQIGGDIFCDTALMCRVIEARHPTPAIFPAQGEADILAQWADRDLFWAAVPYTLQPAGFAAMFAGAPPAFLQAFAADRAAMTQGRRRESLADTHAALQTYLAWLDRQLQDGRTFMLGDSPCIADFSAVQSIWFIRRAPPVASILAPFARVGAWADRMLAFGHGQPESMSSEQALAVAKAAGPQAPVSVQSDQGFKAGEAVLVAATDYAQDAVAGELVGLSPERISLRRHDPRAGQLNVHFPRIGYALRRQDN
ncbi:glutathione S-transferase family protein [Roseateles koreensis]|uniref:Glutathione S-transferase family protein n=1 Tax=Roseateles koreensis TaxID=2987526 RepID=A0ABT5KNQ3_9BURK|nr:glutathione S-transferase family protein [Roseateles koreensis]MDC8783998.1 glutathione S-transferase family protein [Roseateles koreensis]